MPCFSASCDRFGIFLLGLQVKWETSVSKILKEKHSKLCQPKGEALTIFLSPLSSESEAQQGISFWSERYLLINRSADAGLQEAIRDNEPLRA